MTVQTSASPGPGRPAETHALSAERLSRAGAPTLELIVARSEAPPRRPPVLCLHGAYAGAWCWAESWLGSFAELSGYAAAVSLRGHGASEGRATVWRASLADLIEDAARAIAAMPAPPVVVAHSVGGLIAQRLLGRVPMRALALVAPVPPEGLGLLAPWLGLSSFGARLASAGDARAETAAARRKARRIDLAFGSGMPADQAAGYAARLGKGALAGLAEACAPRPVASAFALRVPALVLAGSEDRLIDAATSIRTALYHGAKFREISGAGHFPMLGPEAERGARAVLDWMKRLDP